MMNDLIRRSDVIKEILKGDLLVGDNAGWAIEIVNRTPAAFCEVSDMIGDSNVPDNVKIVEMIKEGMQEKLNDMKLRKMLTDEIFYDYDINLIESDDYCCEDNHPMTKEHTEILGQFMRRFVFDVQQLKEVLIAGYVAWLKIAK